VRVIIFGRLHSEFDAFEVCQGYRERCRWRHPLRVKKQVNLFFEGVGLKIDVDLCWEGIGDGVSVESEQVPKRIPDVLGLVKNN
jgi:hypothetical protein